MLSWVASRSHSCRASYPLLWRIDGVVQFHSSPRDPSSHAKSYKPSSFYAGKNPKLASNSLLYGNSIEPSVAPNSLDFNQNTVLETLSCYSNDWKRALEFFNWVETESNFKHSTETYNRVIGILGKFFEFDVAWDLIEKMRIHAYSVPDHATFRVMFNRYAAAHLVEEAICTYDRIEQFNLKDQISFSNLINALCDHKHVLEAEELCLGKNRKYSYNVDTKIYNMILSGWFKMGWWSKCREFWEEMDRRNVCKDLHSYSIYMDIQTKSGKPWKAVKLYKEMKKKGIQLDVVAYNTVIRAMGLTDGVDIAVRLYKEMIEFGCQPTVATFNTILKLLCENGRTKEAYQVLDIMSKKGCEPNSITYHCFFSCLEKPREILRLFDRMILTGVHPRMDTYVLLMRKFGRWGFLRPIFIVWQKMEEQGLSPDEFAYNALIDALLQKGLIDMARKYDAEMLVKGLSAKPRVQFETEMMSRGSG